MRAIDDAEKYEREESDCSFQHAEKFTTQTRRGLKPANFMPTEVELSVRRYDIRTGLAVTVYTDELIWEGREAMRWNFGKFVLLLSAILLWCADAHTQVWMKLPGGATDIGVGANGAVWIIGGDAVGGGYSIYRWTGSVWEKVPGGATRIAVAPDGKAWVINNTNNIFRWDGATWQTIPGGAIDIGIGADGTVWVLGTNQVPHKWNGSNWTMFDGGATNIAVDPKGIPWVVNAGGQIFRRNAAGTGWDLIQGTAKDISIGADGTPYIVGFKPGAGGFQVYRQTSSGWQEEQQTGVRIAAGPSGVVYVVQDSTTNYAILSRTSGTIVLSGQPIEITGQSIPITGSAPPTQQQGSLDPTSGNLVVGTAVTTQANTPLVVESYLGAPPQKDLMSGSLVCPIIEAGPRLVKGCTFVGEPAVFLGKAPSSSCPSGSFFDPQNGGECWSCPSGYIRNASPVSSSDACWKAVSEDLKPATQVGSTGCPGGTFLDPRNGGECWSCPSGYMRTLVPVTAGDACAKDLIWGPKSSATFHKKAGACDGNSFFDPINGGTCWTCPSGYRRTAYRVDDSKACAQTIPTQYASATLVSGCTKYSSRFGLGTAFRDPRNGGECWACPVQLKRSWSPVDTTKTGNGAACVVGGDTEGIVWQSPQYPEPGMYWFMEGLVDQAFKDARRVDAFIQARANGDPQKRKEIWQRMRSTPHDSPEFKALMFAALVTIANQDGNPKGWMAVNSFADYIRNRRIFVAQDATAMYNAWEDLNAYNQWQAARRASGISGMDPSVLGATPGDYISLAWIAASPDQRGGEFLEALNALGFQGSTGALAPSSPDSGWNPAYLLPIYKAMEKGLDKYSDWAMDTVSWGKISGKAFQTAGKVAGLALIAVQSTVDLSTAIATIVGQEEAKKVYAGLLPEAQKTVNVRDMVRSGREEDLQQLLLFWSLASSPYKAGPKAGQGQLTDAVLCANPSISMRCQSAAAVVTAAGNQVNVWH